MPSADTAVSDRFQLIEVPRAHAARSFAEDVVRGLTSDPKRLSSKYLYDDVGSALFAKDTLQTVAPPIHPVPASRARQATAPTTGESP